MAEIGCQKSKSGVALNSFTNSPGSAGCKGPCRAALRPRSATATHPRADPQRAAGNKAVCALKAMGCGGEGCLKHGTLNCVGGSQGAGHLRPSEVWFQSASPGASPSSAQVAPL